MLCHVFDGLMRVGAQHDGVHPALEIVCDVAESFAFAKALFGLVDKGHASAEACHACFEREARA